MMISTLVMVTVAHSPVHHAPAPRLLTMPTPGGAQKGSGLRDRGLQATVERMYWACGRLENHREHLALHCLGLRGFETYWPQVRGKLKPQSLFPGYCFIKITLQWSAARWAPGVVTLLMNGDEPAKVSDRIISELHARERGGLVVLPAPAPTSARFRAGDQVRIGRGPLSGFVGLVQGMKPRQRVEILLQLLGRVEMAAGDVERA
jgi:transcription antitermination factor NusG